MAFTVPLLSGCQGLPKATFQGCIDCHHKEAKCPELSPPLRSPVADVEIVAGRESKALDVDQLRKKIVALKEVKSVEFIPPEVASGRFHEERPSLEIKLFKGADGGAILKASSGVSGLNTYLKVPTSSQQKSCAACHKKAMKYDIHPRHTKATCKTCHKK